MMVCVENLGEMNKNLLELTSYYSKVSGYKVNIQKPITFLYTSNKQLEFEIKTYYHLLAPSPQKYKYLCMNLYKMCTKCL